MGRGGGGGSAGGSAGHAREQATAPSPAAVMERGGGVPEPSGAQFDYGHTADYRREEVDAFVTKAFGPRGTVRDIAHAIGAPDEARITVRAVEGNALNVGYTAIIGGNEVVASRTIHLHGKEKYVKNEYFEVIKGGVERSAAGFNGYYTWPRFGYNAPIPKEVRGKIPAGLKGAKSVLDLMGSAAGRAFWKEHGIAISAKFDLRPGSRSRQVLSNYIRERRKRGDSSDALRTFTRQVRNAAALGFRFIKTDAAGFGPSAFRG